MSVSNNTLDIGIELEYPTAQGNQTTFTDRAEGSFDLYDLLDEEYYARDWIEGGQVTYDGTVGAEITSPTIGISSAPDWYANSLYELEKYEPHEPTGMLTSHGRGSSAGLHIHMSELSTEQARALAQLSREPFMQVFCCSSVTHQDQRVFRDNYCDVSEFDRQRYSVVHSCAGSGHWEWRMPEPMTTANFDLLMEFLDRFSEDMYDAGQWVKGLVEDADERITAIRRADELNLKDLEAGDMSYPDFDVSRTVPSEVPIDSPADSFFDEVNYNNRTPYIYRITDADDGHYYDRHYYAFWTQSYDRDDTFECEGFEFDINSIFRAHSDGELRYTSTLDSDVATEIIENYRENQTNDVQQTAATEKLAEVVAKKED